MKKACSIRWSVFAVSILIALVSFSWYVEAQQSLSSSLGVIVYPSKGQSAQQQNQAEGECYSWAKQNTGIDPVAAASAQTQGATKGGGERVRGAARGAAGGAAVGAIAGDAGKGAAAGAVVGTMAGGRQKRKAKKEQEQQAEQAKASTLQQFNKAFGACMEGKGYTVK